MPVFGVRITREQGNILNIQYPIPDALQKGFSTRRHGGHGENSGSSQRNSSPSLTFFFVRALCASVLKVFSVQPKMVLNENEPCQIIHSLPGRFAPAASALNLIFFLRAFVSSCLRGLFSGKSTSEVTDICRTRVANGKFHGWI